MTKKHIYGVLFIWISFIFTMIGSYINYVKTGSHFFSFSVLLQVMQNYWYIFFFLIFLLSYFALWQYKFYKKKMENRDNCHIQFVDIERIAEFWLDPEEIEENNKQKEMIKKYIDYETVDKNVMEIILSSNTKNIQLINKYLFQYLTYYNIDEIKIVCILLEIIEENTVSSVISIYQKKEDSNTGELDNEAKKLKSKKSLNGKTNYSILKSVNLEEHTKHVVEEIFEVAKKHTKNNINHMAPILFIIALGHDIGKVINSKKLDMLLDVDKKDKFYILDSHEIISGMILRTIFPDYKHINLIASAVETHHIKYEQSKKFDRVFNYGILLKEADKLAREKELNAYYRSKNIKSDKSAKELFDENTTLTKEDIDKINSVIPSKKNQTNLVSNEHSTSDTELKKTDDLIIDNKDNIEDEVYFNEMKFKSLLLNYLFTVKQLPSGRNRLNAISSDKGDVFHFHKTLIKDILKEIRANGKSVRVLDKQINPVVKDLINKNILEDKSILITNANYLFKPILKHDVYSIKSDYLGYNENEVLLKKRESNLFKNAKVVYV